MSNLAQIWRTFSGIEPYENHQVDCPICGGMSEQRKVKKQLFTEKEYDIDLRPKQHSWSLKYLEWCHPPLYHMWSCKECGFTAADIDFESPAHSHSLEETAFRKSVKQAMQKPEVRAVCSMLQRGAFEEHGRTFLAGLSLHLLAIHILENVEDVVKDEPLVLAQYYLKTAWLYRDLEEGFQIEKEEVASLLQRVGEVWPTVPTTDRACLELAAEFFELGLSSASSIKTIRDEIELIMLIARVWMKLGDSRKAKNLGLYSRERLAHYENCLEKKEGQKTAEESKQIHELNVMHSDMLTMLADA